MRKLLTGLVIVLLTAISQASSSVVFRDPGDSWPWGAELPFPWKGIQGTWVSSVKGQDIYFQFVVIRSNEGFNQLKVVEFTMDGSCTVVSQGAGYEQNRVVKAVMIGPKGAFNMTVHVFKQSDLKEMKAPGYTEVVGAKTITVMSLTPMSGVSPRLTYQLYKVDPDPEAICKSR